MTSAPSSDIDALASKLSHLSTAEEKVAAIDAFVTLYKQHVDLHPTSIVLTPDAKNASDPLGAQRQDSVSLRISELIEEHDLEPQLLKHIRDATLLDGAMRFVKPPMTRMPCANVVATDSWACSGAGKSACSSCKLVLYCSKACQTSHWSIHKRDCKDSVRAANWQPAWAKEARSPTFFGGNTQGSDWLRTQPRLALGMSVWGNMPAVDLLNLEDNEGVDYDGDLKLAFVAIGDLRDVIRTVNDLPDNYSGKLTILINDLNPMIMARNILLLLLLGTVTDKDKASELSLHYWYSAFVPLEFSVQLQGVMLRLLDGIDKDQSLNIPLGSQSSMVGALGSDIVAMVAMMANSTYEAGDVANELQRVRFNPSRKDMHDRHYCRMEPSHRLAFLEFRRFGLVLPFGAPNFGFNSPNRLLFSPEGQWLQDDLANPLNSWSILDIVKTGQRHGVPRADLYGCLYFYLSEQFSSFADKICRLNIHFQVFAKNASQLSQELQRNKLSAYGLTNLTRFDRIDISNLIDIEYLGIAQVLADWGRFIGSQNHAVMVGYSMNWPKRQKGGSATDAEPRVTSRLMKQLVDAGRIPRPSNTGDADTMLGYLRVLDAVYDNSSAFKKYLEQQDMESALQIAKLKLRDKHTIMPHRLCAPLNGTLNTLPVFINDEDWYLQTGIGSVMWSERYVEFSRV